MISAFIYSNYIMESSLYYYDEDFLFYYVCKKLKEIGFKYHHFDYPKSNDVVKIYDDYLDNLKDG